MSLTLVEATQQLETIGAWETSCIALTDLDDASLVARIVLRDQRALEDGYRRHADAAFGLARRVLGDRSRAEEIVQEVFLRLWREPDRFDPARGSLRSFLLAQIHGRSVDALRSDSSRRAREEREARASSPARIDIEAELVEMEVAASVRSALERIPEGERAAIELAYFGGHTYKEVAVLLEQPEGTVKSRIRSGMMRLRSVLAESGITAS